MVFLTDVLLSRGNSTFLSVASHLQKSKKIDIELMLKFKITNYKVKDQYKKNLTLAVQIFVDGRRGD